MKIIILLLFFTTLFSCSQVEDKLDKQALKLDSIQFDSNEVHAIKNNEDSVVASQNTQRLAATDQEFLTFYKRFSTAIINKDEKSFNECFDSNFGLYIIEAPGAMPVISKIYAVSKYKSITSNKKFFELAFEDIEKEPIFDQLPIVNCDENIYNKKGCYANFSNSFIDSQIWNYASLNEKEIQPIEKLASMVTLTVINTSNYSFYFSFIENKWSISFIDLRIPCQV